MAAILFIVSCMVGIERIDRRAFRWPAPLAAIQRVIEPFEIANNYGLFAVMTKQRLEIVLQGSNDGVQWKPYAFKWKPGDVMRRPRFCQPHMPRLDWQMWFAALGDHPEPWFYNFAARLLQGEPRVLHLLAGNPFPDHPPRYVRAVLYDYQFSDRATKAATGAWWARTPAGVFLEPISLEAAEPASDFHL